MFDYGYNVRFLLYYLQSRKSTTNHAVTVHYRTPVRKLFRMRRSTDGCEGTGPAGATHPQAATGRADCADSGEGLRGGDGPGYHRPCERGAVDLLRPLSGQAAVALKRI